MRGESGGKKGLDGEVDAEAVVHRAMWRDGAGTVTIKLESGC